MPKVEAGQIIMFLLNVVATLLLYNISSTVKNLIKNYDSLSTRVDNNASQHISDVDALYTEIKRIDEKQSDKIDRCKELCEKRRTDCQKTICDFKNVRINS